MSAIISIPCLTTTERIAIRLAALNDCAPETAFFQFRRCCGSSKWAEQMVKVRPFTSLENIERWADHVWAVCSTQDQLEAFAAHPRIGEQCDSPWSRQEQSGSSALTRAVSQEVAGANKRYEDRFGYLFIICAAGKSMTDMLAILKERLDNDPREEIHIAAEQQRQITRLRLRKLMSQ
jgi:OHCU decarboxylase